MGTELESTKISKETLDKVRSIVKITKQTINGFITLAVDKKADEFYQEQKKKQK